MRIVLVATGSEVRCKERHPGSERAHLPQGSLRRSSSSCGLGSAWMITRGLFFQWPVHGRCWTLGSDNRQLLGTPSARIWDVGEAGRLENSPGWEGEPEGNHPGNSGAARGLIEFCFLPSVRCASFTQKGVLSFRKECSGCVCAVSPPLPGCSDGWVQPGGGGGVPDAWAWSQVAWVLVPVPPLPP